MKRMAAEKAVVSSDLPGVRDGLGPDASEFLIPAGDEKQFARVLLDLLRNSVKRQAAGRANRARIESEFSVERMIQRYLNIIAASLSDSRRDATLRRFSAIPQSGRPA